MDLLGVRIDVTRPMRGLSIADQQMVEIARALASRQPRSSSWTNRPRP